MRQGFFELPEARAVFAHLPADLVAPRAPQSSPPSTLAKRQCRSARMSETNSVKKKILNWWAGTGLNRRHQDFQSCRSKARKSRRYSQFLDPSNS